MLAARSPGLPMISTPAFLTTFAPPARADWIFALRSTAAGLVALALAYALKLEQPQWAMMTVFIVTQPVAGMVLAKGFFRLVGTLVGTFFAVLMATAVGESQVGFVLVLALWIALCTFVASMLRNPEAYGAALAGYTAAIIGLPAFGNPHLVVELAVARCSEIMLGIVCAGLASRLVLPQLARTMLVERLSTGLADIAAYAAGAIAGRPRAELDALHKRLIVDTLALAVLRAYARLEASSLVTHGRQTRHTIGHMLSAISAIRTLLAHASAPGSAWWPLLGRARAMLEAMAARSWSTEDVRPWLNRLDTIAQEARALRAASPAGDPDPVGAAARLTLLLEFIASLQAVLKGLAALRLRSPEVRPGWKPPALAIFRDRQAALTNALRAGVATALVTAYWMATRWADVAGVAILVAVVSSLFASLPNPLQSAWGFFRGTLYAVPVAFLIGQVAMPALPGFLWFALLVTPVLVPAALFMANPARTGVATAFAINLLVFISPHETMTANPLAFLNTAAAVLGGILLSLAVFAAVLPQRPGDTVERLVGAMRTDLLRLCLHERLPRPSAYESLAYDRINQLMLPLQRLGTAGAGVLEGSLAAVTMGLELLRLRRIAATDAALAEKLGRRLDGLARLLVLKRRGEETLRASVADLRVLAGEIAAAPGPRGLEAAAALRVIAAALEDHPRFFVPAVVEPVPPA